ncbi:hypothetical protein [Actinomadura harenae]|uniref:Uncharacterized protein n=1 Tax=Actinomadura harenae TaxID=2483351 RepID=A0A3M2LJU0_9ACTN|nr:hypothetical protein [Actinomadura harenae]RMI37724.1 hypothetical protein EBO15_35000 [Actinomadura harenae]
MTVDLALHRAHGAGGDWVGVHTNETAADLGVLAHALSSVHIFTDDKAADGTRFALPGGVFGTR